MTVRHLLPMSMNKKLECRDNQIFSKMLRKICEKEVLSQFHPSQKIHLLINVFFICMVKTFLKILYFGGNHLLPAQKILYC